MAAACVYLMENRDFKDTYPPGTREIRNTHINIGTGEDVAIAELAELVRKTVGFGGRLAFDPSRPDGTMNKLTDVSRLHSLGWRHRVTLDEGVRRLYEWYLENADARR